MRVLIHAGMCEPSLSARGVMRLRELGWKPAFNPNDDEEGKMILSGERNHVGDLETSNYTMLTNWIGKRHDPILLQVFDELEQDMFASKEECEKAGLSFPAPEHGFSEMVYAVEIPDGTDYEIYQWDGGWESIHEKHRTWTVPDPEA